MSTIIVAVILVGIVAVVCLLLISLDKKQKRKVMNDLLQRFSRLGSAHDLNFSGQEILKDTVIGLDGVHRKLAVLHKRNEHDFDSCIIDLNEVKACTVKKRYGTIGVGDLRAKNLEHYLEMVALHFAFINEKRPVEVMFYNHIDHAIYQLPELENKARHWEAMLSKMHTHEKKRA